MGNTPSLINAGVTFARVRLNPGGETPRISTQGPSKRFTLSVALGQGGTLTVASMGNTPSLIDAGVTFARVRLNPGGANSPHIHPRAVEALYVIRGTLQVCFAEENGGVTICNLIRQGEATFFPQGTIHSQQNVGHQTAEFLAVLTSSNPGTLTVSSRFFSLPDSVLSAALNLPAANTNSIRNGIPANPVPAGPGYTY
eukprot:CAMPEP_0184689236 /NCGR_PEP_ID=MMETSP0312-20130426/30545_1 /TAXON_ID=31354 /ORGANISM="Compsopogon coeruleus, Strain SAG 36.94" /LENGTH=197 /DNA_ID=CAMNT_0027146565 /DNA_START=239 /DNA_END=833 /DNA_ORIENTATION=+